MILKNFTKKVLVLGIIFFPNLLFAAGLVPDCGTTYTCNFCDIIQLINNVLEFFVMLSIPISMVIFAWIGWDFIVIENKPEAISNAKKRLMSLIIGLFFLLAPWLIINLIMSSLLNENFFNVLKDGFTCERTLLAEPKAVTTPPTTTSISPEGTASVSEIEKLLEENSIETVSSGNCSFKFSKNCTSFDGMQESTIDGIINLADGCRADGTDCNVTITGASEVGHTDTHTEGKKVDISKNDVSFNNFMDSLISGVEGKPIKNVGVRYSDIQYNGTTYTIIEEGNHWDIEVN